jgi:hypothetical protein
MGGINVWFIRPSQLKPSNHLEADDHQMGEEKKHKLGWQDRGSYGNVTRIMEQESGKKLRSEDDKIKPMKCLFKVR